MQPIIPRSPISIRPATLDDLPAIDAMQKKFRKALGYFPTSQLKGYLESGGVLKAVERRTEDSGLRTESDGASLSPQSSALSPLGYVIWRDRYLKRDELGVIFQLCVAPGEHRKLIGASLVKAAFERSAYGCRLFCLWCAQDLEANRFWESLGFIPIAFRTGSQKRRRVHIFWQRRVRADDTPPHTTPYWFPSRTSGGAIGQDRIVFPIPHGMRWDDPMPIVLPDRGKADERALPDSQVAGPSKARRRKITPVPGMTRYGMTRSVLYFGAGAGEKPKARPERPAAKKCSPRLLAMARELRDRWLEHVNADEPVVLSHGTYDVARIAPGKLARIEIHHTMRSLPAPIAA